MIVSGIGSTFAVWVSSVADFAGVVSGAAIVGGAAVFRTVGLAMTFFGTTRIGFDFSVDCTGAGMMPGDSCASAGTVPSKKASTIVGPPKYIARTPPLCFVVTLADGGEGARRPWGLPKFSPADATFCLRMTFFEKRFTLSKPVR
ncbi:MAG TPA: hypothetical protein VIV34_01230 [Pseudolabrys sp.]